MIRTNIRIYSYQKNNTNEYLNIFASKKWYEYDTNEYSYWKIFEYIRISEYSPHPELHLFQVHTAAKWQLIKIGVWCVRPYLDSSTVSIFVNIDCDRIFYSDDADAVTPGSRSYTCRTVIFSQKIFCKFYHIL